MPLSPIITHHVFAVDLSSWRARLDRAEEAAARGEEEEEEEQQEEAGDSGEADDGDGDGVTVAPRQWERYRHGVLTLGCVGEGRGLVTGRGFA